MIRWLVIGIGDITRRPVRQLPVEYITRRSGLITDSQLVRRTKLLDQLA